jgi:hypothetical protein
MWKHKNLRVITQRGAQYGENVGNVVVFPTEYRELQREYPIFFRKDPGGTVTCRSPCWASPKTKISISRITPGTRAIFPRSSRAGRSSSGSRRHRQTANCASHRSSTSISIIRESARRKASRCSSNSGAHAPYLQEMTAVLDRIHRGLALSKDMFAAFTALDLIDPITLEVKLDANEQHNLLGYFTVNHEKLRALDAASLAGLHRSGFLESAYLVTGSVSNVQKLVDRKLERRRGSTAS